MQEPLPSVGTFWSRCVVEPEEFLPIKENNRQDGPELYDESESVNETVALTHTQQVLRNNHVAGRGNRQKLRKSLDYGNDDGLQPRHSSLSLSFVRYITP